MSDITMIRTGSFGTDFEAKLAFALFGAAVAVWDAWRNRRADYLWVFLVGTIAWTLVEASLQARGVRVFRPDALFGTPVPGIAQRLVQGAAEGAAVAVLGVFFGDRLLDGRTRAPALAGLALFCAAVAARPLAETPPELARFAEMPASRREVFLPQAIAFFGVVGAISGGAWWRRPASRPRLAAMTLVMLAVSTVWTVAEVWAGTRGIQIAGAVPGAHAPAPPLLAAAVLAYDVVFEITLAYVPFLALPVLLGLVRTEPVVRLSGAGSSPPGT